MCAIDANIVLEKIIIFTWFYYVAFALILIYVLVFDFIWLLFPSLRRRYIRSLLYANIPTKFLKIYQNLYHTKIPVNFQCPYQVALFATYVSYILKLF